MNKTVVDLLCLWTLSLTRLSSLDELLQTKDKIIFINKIIVIIK